MKALHFSALREMAKSPAHYLCGLTTPREDSDAMRFGRIVHTMVLGGPEVRVWQGGRRAGKEWEAFREELGAADYANGDEYTTCQEIAASVMACEAAREVLVGEKEKKLEWTLPNGRPCAGRIDVFGTAGHVTELKTTRDAQPERFLRDALRRSYHAQLAWYADGLDRAGLVVPVRYHIVAVETDPPYAVTVFDLTENAIDLGRRTYHSWLERLQVCEENDSWPAYVSAAIPFEPPAWALDELYEEEDMDDPKPITGNELTPFARIKALDEERAALLLSLKTERVSLELRLAEIDALIPKPKRGRKPKPGAIVSTPRTRKRAGLPAEA